MEFKAWVPAGARAHIARRLEDEYSDSAERDLYLRFAQHDDMRGAYSALATEFNRDEQCRDFLTAAWVADADYRKVRERVERAKEIGPKIGEYALELISLLEEARRLGTVTIPSEFKAPQLPDLLSTVATAALAWNPEPAMAEKAAIASRKRNRSSEYLRAFANVLIMDYGIAPQGKILAAMAHIANVVLNDPKTVLTTDGARKAIKPRMEDSD